jgi:hypothetical protein
MPIDKKCILQQVKKNVNGMIPINNDKWMTGMAGNLKGLQEGVELLPLPQPALRARTDAHTNPSAHRATQLRSVLARVYAVSRQNQITTTVP